MNHLKLFFFYGAIALLSCNVGDTFAKDYKISKGELLNKIKGGWAGQVIGCTYGGPTEFKWNGTMIGEEIGIPWDGSRMSWYYKNSPGLYDDVYMDLTFVRSLTSMDWTHPTHYMQNTLPMQATRYGMQTRLPDTIS